MESRSERFGSFSSKKLSLLNLRKNAYMSSSALELVRPGGGDDEENMSLLGEQSNNQRMAVRTPGAIESLKNAMFGSKFNLLLIFVILGVVAPLAGWDDTYIFLFNFLAILPLARLLGDSTEEVAIRTNETLGGLLNATFGNATELIISIFALKHKYYRVVQVSLLGSILSNQLLVMGCSFFFGGILFHEQHFNRDIAGVYGSLLLMAVLGLVVPTAFAFTEDGCSNDSCPELLDISRATAVILVILYVALLVFQLRTHRSLMEEAEEDDDEGPQQPNMSLGTAIGMLAASTVLVALCSEYLVDSIESVAQQWNLSEMFIGLILLPIVGNAAEHATAVTVAMKGKMDLSIGVALGSSIQIALFVIPLLVIVAWMWDLPLSLDFHAFEAVVLIVSVFVVNSVVGDGSSTWLEGAMLIGAYCIIAIAYYYRDNTDF
eukprot:TRINITY_DN394_c0_g1::TRINITY_DN394_c0_g1_i1::g.7558::m.7558 TRINITY_DN394_c0_g1::TRINITY_DN394_c0_g1_i1::g.7558  ORF type:complete len:454 (+),score=95.08,sp/Q99385/VCX1_YEAST/45.69/5e-97,Na_Ca_ex/PF01699.19/99,Na_Ca_ex/PF01699.19/9.4e-20,Na_Ca_ex/PF01699.19/1.4e-24,SBF/PF01758.11/5.5e+03,SBF/PF01758.11/1.1e+03,SBF/PF01758.11/0.3,SBF/PF01758.11/2.7e+03 TRINITY_DN394_c0_g1_i1:61-1362(+)